MDLQEEEREAEAENADARGWMSFACHCDIETLRLCDIAE
jgi:hypothetical protein